MPTVPTEQNRTGIADVTDAKLQPGDYSGTGLQALGAGMQQLGGVGAKIAGDVQQRQDSDDAFEIKKAWNAYAEGARSIRADAIGKFDADPQGMLQRMTQDYGGLRDWIRSGLKNDRQRGQFDQVIAERFDYDLSGALTESERALQRGQDQQSLLLEQNAADDAVDNADDPALFDKHLHTGAESIAGRAAARGDDPATIDQSVTAYRSGIQRRALQNVIDRDPVAAANRYRTIRDGMTAADQQTARKELFEPLARALGARDVDGLLPPPEMEGPAPLSPEQRTSVAEAIEAQPWTDARKYYAREDLATRGSLEDRQRKQAADAAKDKGLAIAEQLGPDFTSIMQLPPEVRRDLDDDTMQTLGLQAQDNLDGRPVAPNGETSLMMNLIASQNPAAFAKEDLRLVRGKVTPEEYETLERVQRGVSGGGSADGGALQRRVAAILRPSPDFTPHIRANGMLRNAAAGDDRITFDMSGRPVLGTGGKSVLEAMLEPLLPSPSPVARRRTVEELERKRPSKWTDLDYTGFPAFWEAERKKGVALPKFVPAPAWKQDPDIQNEVDLAADDGPYDRITLHHTGSRDTPQAVDDLHRGRESNMAFALRWLGNAGRAARYNDADTDYHFLIGEDGTIYEGRSLKYKGAHVYEKNSRNIGIAFLGDFTDHELSRAQFNSAKFLIRELNTAYDVSGKANGQPYVFTHTDLASSAKGNHRRDTELAGAKRQTDILKTWSLPAAQRPIRPIQNRTKQVRRP